MTGHVGANALALLQSKSRSGKFPRKQHDSPPGWAFTLRRSFQFVSAPRFLHVFFEAKYVSKEVSELAIDLAEVWTARGFVAFCRRGESRSAIG